MPVDVEVVIREARAEDAERIVEMGSRSLRIGPYKDELGDNPTVTRRLYELLINNPQAKIIVSDEGGLITGLLAFIVFPHYYSGETTAGEIIWYVEPEYRTIREFSKGRRFTAFELLDEAERLAKSMGAVRMQLTAPTEAVALAYKRRGYHQIEVSFQRKL